MCSPSKQISRGYVILYLMLDDQQEEKKAPVGVAAWDASRKWFGLRAIAKTIKGIEASQMPCISISVDKLHKWAGAKQVPYYEGVAQPWTSAFWQAAGEIMTTAVQLSRPRALAMLEEPDIQIERLFEAVVKPEANHS